MVERAAREARAPVSVVDGLGGALPFDDAAFDAAVASLVLCSVPEQDPVLGDLFRVIRPGGELRFYERTGNDPTLVRLQDRTAPTEAGRIEYTCSMGMYGGRIEIV